MKIEVSVLSTNHNYTFKLRITNLSVQDSQTNIKNNTVTMKTVKGIYYNVYINNALNYSF